MISKEKRQQILALSASLTVKIGTLTIDSLLNEDEELADDLGDIQNRLIALLEKHNPKAHALAGTEFFTRINEEIKRRDIENLTKEKN